MVTWENLLDGYNPLTDFTNSWDVTGWAATVLASPSDQLVSAWDVSFWYIMLNLPGVISRIVFIFAFGVVPICIFLMLFWTLLFRPIIESAMMWLHSHSKE